MVPLAAGLYQDTKSHSDPVKGHSCFISQARTIKNPGSSLQCRICQTCSLDELQLASMQLKGTSKGLKYTIYRVIYINSFSYQYGISVQSPKQKGGLWSAMYQRFQRAVVTRWQQHAGPELKSDANPHRSGAAALPLPAVNNLQLAFTRRQYSRRCHKPREYIIWLNNTMIK